MFSFIRHSIFKSHPPTQEPLIVPIQNTASSKQEVNVISKTVDPANMTNEENSWLRILFKKFNQTIYPSEMDYEIQLPDQDTKLKLRLTNKIICRQSKGRPNEVRYEIISKQLLGEGTFAKVYPVIGTLVPEKNGTLTFKKQDRILKYFEYLAKTNEQNAAEKELHFGQLVQHLHMKRPVYVTNGKLYQTYLIEKKIPGTGLQYLLEDELNKGNILSVDERLKVSKNILSTLKQQVHDQNLIHKDIKQENIMFDRASLEVNFIDFGFSKKKEYDDKGESSGTPGYAAYEVYSRMRTDETTDIYAVGRVLAELWHDQPACFDSIYEYQQFAWHSTLSSLFDKIDGISQLHQDKLRNLFLNMTRSKQKNRCSLQSAIDVIDEIILERKLEFVLPNEQEKFKTASMQGKKLSMALNVFCRNHVGHTTVESLNHLKQLLKEKLSEVKNEPNLIKEFIESSDINLFLGLDSAEKIIQKADDIIHEFTNVTTELKSLQNKINKINTKISSKDIEKQKLVHELSDAISFTFSKVSRYSLSFNNTVMLTRKIKKEIDKIQPKMKQLEKDSGIINCFFSMLRLFKPRPAQQHLNTQPKVDYLKININ
ncbi:MAG: serine threonine protein kinase [uncultured bacterium]|nr:MAG: serine threonine protein kinase [uncultured bacterium]